MHSTVLTHPFLALLLWDKDSSIHLVLRCQDWHCSISLRTPKPPHLLALLDSIPHSFQPSSLGTPQLGLDTLLFHFALLQHDLWYSSFPPNTPHLALLFSPSSYSHFSSECIILPLILPFRFAAS